MRTRYRVMAAALSIVALLPLTSSTAQAGVLDTVSPGALTLAPGTATDAEVGEFRVRVDRRTGLTVTADGRKVWAAASGKSSSSPPSASCRGATEPACSP